MKLFTSQGFTLTIRISPSQPENSPVPHSSLAAGTSSIPFFQFCACKNCSLAVRLLLSFWVFVWGIVGWVQQIDVSCRLAWDENPLGHSFYLLKNWDIYILSAWLNPKARTSVEYLNSNSDVGSLELSQETNMSPHQLWLDNAVTSKQSFSMPVIDSPA